MTASRYREVHYDTGSRLIGLRAGQADRLTRRSGRPRCAGPDGSPDLTTGNSEIVCVDGAPDEVDGLSQATGTDPSPANAPINKYYCNLMNALGVKAGADGFPAPGGSAPVTHFGMYDRTEDFIGGGTNPPTLHDPGEFAELRADS